MSEQLEFLNGFLKEKRISRAELARRAGMNATTVSNILNGRYNISRNFAAKMSALFGISMNYLRYGDGEPMDSEPIASDGRVYKVTVAGRFKTVIRARAVDKESAENIAKRRVADGEFQEEALKIDASSLEIVE